MSVLYCTRCDNRRDTDWEEWCEELDCCQRCADKEAEELLKQQAAQAAEDAE